ncbi:rod shape-determining protein MreD [Streptococcus dentapri]|uniref:Rod shape-determining protein MreD n=1 Tax=Streptococcus dentapri TaxID=573564 RepID=A0ABV8D2B9_9STRE
MKFFKNNLFISILAFLLLLIDGHFSDLLTALAGHSFFIQTHLFLIFFFYFLRFSTSDYFSYLLAFGIGLIYDSYYLSFIGIACIILPVLVYLIIKFSRYFGTPIRRILAFFIFLFLYDISCYGLAVVYRLTTYSFSAFVTYQLVGSLIFNLLIFLVLSNITYKRNSK